MSLPDWKSNEIDGYDVLMAYLLTYGEEFVDNGTLPFKPLIDFALIHYGKRVNATNRLAMKYDLTKFFRLRGDVLEGGEMKKVTVLDNVYREAQRINNQYRKDEK